MGTRKKDKRRYVNTRELLANHLPWSKATLFRRIANEGFPYIDDGDGSKLFDLQDVENWMKMRKQNVG